MKNVLNHMLMKSTTAAPSTALLDFIVQTKTWGVLLFATDKSLELHSLKQGLTVLLEGFIFLPTNEVIHYFFHLLKNKSSEEQNSKSGFTLDVGEGDSMHPLNKVGSSSRWNITIVDELMGANSLTSTIPSTKNSSGM